MPNDCVPKPFLHLQVVVIEVRYTRVLANGVDTQALRIGGGGTIRIRAGGYSRENRFVRVGCARIRITRGARGLLHRIPLVTANNSKGSAEGCAISRVRGSAECIALNPSRCGDG